MKASPKSSKSKTPPLEVGCLFGRVVVTLLIPLRHRRLASCGGAADPETTVRSTVEVLNCARDAGIKKFVVTETTWIAKAVSRDGRYHPCLRGQEDVLSLPRSHIQSSYAISMSTEREGSG